MLTLQNIRSKYLQFKLMLTKFNSWSMQVWLENFQLKQIPVIDSSLFNFQPLLDEHNFFMFRYAALLKNKCQSFQNVFLISQAQNSYVKNFSNQSLLTITQSILNIGEPLRWAYVQSPYQVVSNVFSIHTPYWPLGSRASPSACVTFRLSHFTIQQSRYTRTWLK